MYFVTEDNSLHITKGDDVYFKVDIYQEDSPDLYELNAHDHLHFTVRYMPVSLGEEYDEPIMEVDSDSLIIHLPHEMTKDLEVGIYSADIQLCKDLETYTGNIDDDYDIITVWPIHEHIKKCGRIHNFKNFVVDPEVSTHHR